MTGAYQFLKKYGVAIGFGTGTVLAILTYTIILAGYPELNPTEEELYDMSIFDFGLYTSYGLIIIACLLVAIFSAMYVAKNPKDSIKGLAGFAVILVLFFITNAMGDGGLTAEIVNSDPTLLPTVAKEVSGTTVMVPAVLVEGVTQSSGLQFADGLIKFSYIMMSLAIIAMLFALGRDFVKQS
jgi:hypothetical protein